MTRLVVLLLGAVLAGAASAEMPDGAAIFSQNCALCHQSGGAGLPGQFPRLAGRIGPISAKPAGRAYLVDVLTYGMVGQVTVDGQPIIGVMPPFASLPDEQVAAVLGYLQSLGGAPKEAFTAAEVTEGRSRDKKSGSDVLAERKSLVSSGVIK
jgi:mono/diheme cytochrome c family protein